MTDIFDSIPIITAVLLTLGIIGITVYERTRLREEKKQNN
jgi:hypothetical protein